MYRSTYLAALGQSDNGSVTARNRKWTTPFGGLRCPGPNRPQLRPCYNAQVNSPVESDYFSVRLLGDSVLRQRAEQIETFGPDLEALVDKMRRTLFDFRVGVGLAAPQVGVSKRVVVYDKKYAGGPGYFINPRIVSSVGRIVEGEGCLSFPGDHFPIERAKEVSVATLDLDGTEHTYSGSGLFARLCQHEIDHLNGKLVVDHIDRRSKLRSKRRLAKRLQALGLSADATAVSMTDVDKVFLMTGDYDGEDL